MLSRGSNIRNYFTLLTVTLVVSLATGAPKLINSDLFLEKRATVPIKTRVFSLTLGKNDKRPFT